MKSVLLLFLVLCHIMVVSSHDTSLQLETRSKKIKPLFKFNQEIKEKLQGVVDTALAVPLHWLALVKKEPFYVVDDDAFDAEEEHGVDPDSETAEGPHDAGKGQASDEDANLDSPSHNLGSPGVSPCLEQDICKLQLGSQEMCYDFQTGLMGQCISLAKTEPCDKSLVISCHPFPHLAKTVLEPFPEEEESSDDDPSAADEVLEKRMIERTAKTQPDGSLFSTIRDLADRVVFLVSRNVGGLKQLIDDAKKEDGGDKILLGVVIDEEKESVDQEHLLEIINRSAHDILNNDQGHPCLLQDPSSLGHHDPVALISKVDTDCLFAQAASKVFQDKGDGFQRDQFRERLLKAIDRLGQVDDDQEFLITQRTQRLSNRFSKRDESVTLIDFLSNLFEVKMQLLKTLVKPSPPITSRTTTTTTTATTTTITTTATTTTTTQGPVRIAEEQATTTTTTTTRTTTTTTTATTTTTTTTQGPVRTAEEQALVDLFGHDPFEAFNEDPEDPASLIYFDPSDATFVLNSATSFSPASSSDEVFEIQIHVADEQEMHEVETIVTFDPSDSTLELHKSPEHKVSFTGEESGKASDDPVSSEVNAEEVMIIFDPGHGNLDLTGNSQTPETIQELAGSHFPRDLEGAIEGTLEEESKKATSQDPGAVLFPDDDKKPTTKKYCKIDYSEKLCIEVDDNSIVSCPSGAAAAVCSDLQLQSAVTDARMSVGKASSSWPWFRRSSGTSTSGSPTAKAFGSLSSPGCQCLGPMEVFALSGVVVGQACAQAIPWCYVSPDSGCPDVAVQPGGLAFSMQACAHLPAQEPTWKFF